MKVQIFLIAISFVFIFSSFQASARSFGSDGWDGRNGEDGFKGRNGLPVSLFADGSYKTLDVSGEDGTDATNGEYGEDARFCSHQNRPPYNLEGADGGDGGNSGDGGSGGDTGSVTVFYDQVSNLNKISVRSLPGRAGYAGNGRSGGRGCDCYTSSWQVTAPDGTVQTYRCSDGTDGWRGRSGTSGYSGMQYPVRIVKDLRSIPAENPSERKSIVELNNETTNLKNNIWIDDSNGSRLFSPDSIMPSSVEVFSGVANGDFNLQWESTRSISHFANARAVVSIEDDSSMDFNPDANFVLNYSKTNTANGMDVTIHEGIFAEELEALRFNNVEGKDSLLTLHIDDTTAIGNLVNTKVHLKYKVQKFVSYRIRYEDFVPESALVIEDNKISIKIGSLPIDLKYLKGGAYAKVVVKVTREFEGISKETEIKEKFQIIKD